ncbi:transposase [Streptomyces sp. NPDC096311]|uniref:transposase n=1 Tax=Streptomyces sp. NPDC096311 TaxID=3366083 RepID=UPI0037F274C1
MASSGGRCLPTSRRGTGSTRSSAARATTPWSRSSTRLRAMVREKPGRDAEPTAGVIDSQSVEADTVVGAESRGFDGGKQINGRKRRVVVDTLGPLLGVMVTTADTGDRTAAHILLRHVAEHTTGWPWSGLMAAAHRQPRRVLPGRSRAGPDDRQTQRRPQGVRGAAEAARHCPSGASSSGSSPTCCAPAAWRATTSAAPPAPRRWPTGR